VDLEGNVELAAFQRGLEEQGMAQGATRKTRVLAAVGPQPGRAEGDTQDVGIDRLQLEGRAVGADRFDANSAASDAGAQFGADGAEPVARVAGAGNEALSHRLQPDDLSLPDPNCLLLFRQGEGFGGDKAVVDEHERGRGPRQKAPGVRTRFGCIALREDGGFRRLTAKRTGDPADGVLVGDRVHDCGVRPVGDRALR